MTGNDEASFSALFFCLELQRQARRRDAGAQSLWMEPVPAAVCHGDIREEQCTENALKGLSLTAGVLLRRAQGS